MNLLFNQSSLSAPDPHLPGGRRETPVVGWRSWKLRPSPDGAALESLFGGERWETGVTRARCRRCAPWTPPSQHPVPKVSCQCGLYAFGSAAEAVRHAREDVSRILAGTGQGPAAIGAVIGWGRIVQHGARGWRAQYATPIALLDTGDPLLQEAALRYGAELVSEHGLHLLPLEFGAPLPAA